MNPVGECLAFSFLARPIEPTRGPEQPRTEKVRNGSAASFSLSRRKASPPRQAVAKGPESRTNSGFSEILKSCEPPFVLFHDEVVANLFNAQGGCYHRAGT